MKLPTFCIREGISFQAGTTVAALSCRFTRRVDQGCATRLTGSKRRDTFGEWNVPEPSPPILTNGHLRLRRCRHGIMLYNLNDTHLGTMLDLYGEYSEAEADMFRHFLKAGMTAVEVGANIGAHTLALAGLVGRQGRVLAFEPQRVVFQMLCANLAVNAIEHVEAHWAAVGSAPGTITVPRVSGTERANFGGLAAGGAQGDEVRLLALDSLELPACDFLKIDVEGMEHDVLLGARKTIGRLRPTISVENDREEKSPALIRALWDLDYDCYWDIPRYIHVPNFRGNTENIFPTMSSFNLLCLPRERKRGIGGLRKVEGTLDVWPPIEAFASLIHLTDVAPANSTIAASGCTN